ncbi:endonuclease domain-containing protein [Arthrobacter sp. CJ23]|uniref:endonuclease domain-containing protein n=1 Tax=Arthrobacter sp. CJ23 TaxID=2972479 RepID=UPI00215BF5A3|nr:endonuclease domain-containing protein [Arthrobacter sp. CJ23]UVJ40693.1 endonuclease domain-containing protein [Arthrobacter sp. CJ23]
MPRKPLPEELLTGSFTSAAAEGLGVPGKRIRAADVFIPSRSIRVPLNGSADAAANLRAYTDLDDSSVLTHHSAVRIWEGSLPAWLQEDWRIHVARDRAGSKPRRRNVVGHRMTFRPGEVVVHDGVRVTIPARTWLDLAALLSVDDLVALGDSLVVAHGPDFPRPKTALTAIDDLRRMVAAHPGMRGMRTARLALPEVRVGADSPQETRMRLVLSRTGLGEPMLNHVIRNSWGQPAVWPDAAYPQHRIALQYDGGHHADPNQYLHDIRRQATTERLGWKEVRVSKEDLEGEKPFLVEKVRAALRPLGFGSGSSAGTSHG